jgi:hypothetical protein
MGSLKGIVALMLGLVFHIQVDEDLAIRLCQRHYDEALLVSKVVLPPLINRSELEHAE